MESEKDQSGHLFYTLFGPHAYAFPKIMRKAGRDPDFWKIDSFLSAPDSGEGINRNLGLDLREIICTVSKTSPAVTYHRSFGLVIEGEVKAYFDNDTGKVLQEDGRYNDYLFEFTHQTTRQFLLGPWYEQFTGGNYFIWNEAILDKGSRVIGAFYDPQIDRDLMKFDYSHYQEREFDLFFDKAQKIGLPLIPISAKFKP